MTPMPRRANHEGTVPRKLPNRELYRVRVMLGGKGHDVYGKTAKLAGDKARSMATDWERGLMPLDPKYTVGQWLDDWIRLYCDVRPRTLISYSDTVRLYLKPMIEDVRLAKLTPDQVQKMLATVRGPRRELSPTTKRYIYSVLRIALGRAVKVGKLHRNVAELVDPPADSGFRAQPLTADEAAKLRTALANHRHEALILTALSCGLREGELLGLTWPAVDLDRGTVEVRWQLDRVTRLLVEPKRESRRTIGLPAMTIAALTARKSAQRRDKIGKKDWDPREFVFTTKAGQPLGATSSVRAFQTILRDAGLPRQRLHDLRHAYATFMIEGGTDLAIVSKLLGHRNVSTTSDVYGHLTETMRDEAAQRMERTLRRPARKAT